MSWSNFCNISIIACWFCSTASYFFIMACWFCSYFCSTACYFSIMAFWFCSYIYFTDLSSSAVLVTISYSLMLFLIMAEVLVLYSEKLS